MKTAFFHFIFGSSLVFSQILTGAALAADPASDMGLVPHRALYEIDLAGTHSGAQIVNVDGQMFYEWQPACDGWNSNHRFNLFYEYADNPSVKIASDFSTFESFDGNSLNFTSQRKRDGVLFEEIRGHALKGPDTTGEAGDVMYKMPEGLVYDLPAGSLFPMGHTMGMIEHLRANKAFYTATVFDGSDDGGPVQVNSFIGKRQSVPPEILALPTVDEDLLRDAGYRAQLAFFPLSSPSSKPDYEMTLTFHENGIISEMLIQYDDFSVRQTLKALERLDSQCENIEFNE